MRWRNWTRWTRTGRRGELDAAPSLMQGAERIRDDVARAMSLWARTAPKAQMGDALRWLDGVARRGRWHAGSAIGGLGRAHGRTGRAAWKDRGAASTAVFQSARVWKTTEERLFAIRGMARKHDVSADDLAALPDDLRAKLAALDAGDADWTQCARALDAESAL